MQPIYDLVCGMCGRQLDFRETYDLDGDKIVIVQPCTCQTVKSPAEAATSTGPQSIKP